MLWRNGLVPAAELDRCGRMVQAGRPLGQVLVEEGLLDPGQLYGAMGLQVREIVLGAFLDDDGEFVFVEGRSDERNAVRLPERTRDLLLEGMRRRSEVEAISFDVPPGTPWPAAGPAGRHPARREGRPPARRHRRRANRAPGARGVHGSAPTRARASLQALVRDGWVEAVPRARAVAASSRSPGIPAGGPFEAYARIIRHVHEELSRVQADAGRRLESFFERMPPARRAVFEGVRIGADGDIDVAQLLLNVGQGKARARARRRAPGRSRALESFLAFALFEVENCLPPAEADRVLAEVGRMQGGAT